jgi:hypothetical protein
MKKRATDARLAGDRRGVRRLTPNPSSACARGCDRRGDVIVTDAVHGTVVASVAWAHRGSTRQTHPSARHRTRLTLRRDNVATGPRLTVARQRLSVVTDAFVVCWCEQQRRARGGCDKHWTASVAESTDASVERSAKIASLDHVCRRDRRWTLS